MNNMSYGTPGGGDTESYRYNESGERVTKRKGETGQATTETNYANQFMSVSRTDGDTRYVATKNYYLGMERIASQVMPVGFSGVTSAVYVYHSDHLGSTTYLTDLSGDIKEHIEYTPWGESWVENTGASFIPNYKFTGKEQDRTGLYYFGARYYDPQVSLWVSADPILGEYLPESNFDSNKIDSLAGYGGVFQSKNLSLMTFVWNNPVNLTDDYGMSVTTLCMTKGQMPIVNAIQQSYAVDRNLKIISAKVEIVAGYGALVAATYITSVPLGLGAAFFGVSSIVSGAFDLTELDKISGKNTDDGNVAQATLNGIDLGQDVGDMLSGNPLQIIKGFMLAVKDVNDSINDVKKANEFYENFDSGDVPDIDGFPLPVGEK